MQMSPLVQVSKQTYNEGKGPFIYYGLGLVGDLTAGICKKVTPCGNTLKIYNPPTTIP